MDTIRGVISGTPDKNADRYRSGPPDLLADKIFINQINLAIEQTYDAYDK